MVFHIAVCSPDAALRSGLERQCMEYFARRQDACIVQQLPDADALLRRDTEGERFDLYLIELGAVAAPAGLSAAVELRRRGRRAPLAFAARTPAHAYSAFRVDASEEGDPMMALVEQFTNTDYDVLLYDPQSSKNRRGEFVANLVKESGAQGLVLFMQQFCDPEEMEYPYLKKALDGAGIPHIKLGVDQQMRDFGQASTAIQAFADVL